MFNLTYYLFIILFILLAGCKPKEQINTFIEPQCLVSQSQCKIKMALGEFDVLFNVESVITEQEFSILIKSNLSSENIEIKGFLEGKEMYMGKIPLFFTQSQPQRFSASTMLGSCAEEEMIWRMWLIISDNTHQEKTQKVFIDFKSYRQ